MSKIVTQTPDLQHHAKWIGPVTARAMRSGTRLSVCVDLHATNADTAAHEPVIVAVDNDSTATIDEVRLG
ncbi:MAG: hypothetical protein WCI29_10900 [Actinomycetes bacterium]